ncbi:phosphocholine cytidylyltransferase family protein [soil metagenome]
MKALILAAGRGSRLGELTKDKPKGLMPLAGKTLIEWQLEALRNAGVADIAMVRGYRGDLLEFTKVVFFENTIWERTNMVSSLVCAGSWMKDDDCIISYSDIVYPKETIDSLLHESADICLTYNLEWWDVWNLRFEDPLEDAETFRVDQNGMVIEIGGKAKSVDDIKGQYMGLLKFTPRGWHIIESYLLSLKPDEIAKLDMTSLLSRLIKNGVAIKGIPIQGMWYEVDNEADLKTYTSLVEKGKSWMNELIK